MCQTPEKPWGRLWLQTQNLKLGDGWEDSTHLEPGPHPTGARALYKADVTWGKPRGQEGGCVGDCVQSPTNQDHFLFWCCLRCFDLQTTSNVSTSFHPFFFL